MDNKPNRFKINRPQLDEAAVKRFAAAAEIIPEEKLVTLKSEQDEAEKTTPEHQESTQGALKDKKQAKTPPKEKEKPVTADLKKKAEPKWPWSDIDDKTARTTGYTLQFPASVYAKLKFLGDNEPGGPSVRKIVMDALEGHLDKKLARYIKGERKD